MAQHVYEVDAKCSDCKGTGLYAGMAENGGAAVVCTRCEGKGHRLLRLEWEDFDGRGMREGVTRIYRANPGIVIGESEDRRTQLKDFGGMSYADWDRGFPWPEGSEDRKHTCPAWFYQAADYKLKPAWEECSSNLGRCFSGCDHFPSKVRCWERWDQELAPAGAGR